ncbi:hypothetical protein ARMGADRAFT_1065215 [Armillaria gallica]|uniref:Uncharacterized protein n=1 Tax=Armillaria gallica TaxID=47427 RepID=A0A2H3DPN3_ARMGA|nr:hypothetical protein ARMGADRAFT_1065215 [Armillaria gallica]
MVPSIPPFILNALVVPDLLPTDPNFIMKKSAAEDPFELEMLQNSGWADIFGLNAIAPFCAVRASQSLLVKRAVPPPTRAMANQCPWRAGKVRHRRATLLYLPGTELATLAPSACSEIIVSSVTKHQPGSTEDPLIIFTTPSYM